MPSGSLQSSTENTNVVSQIIKILNGIFKSSTAKIKAKHCRTVRKRILCEWRNVSRWWNLSWVLSAKLETEKEKRAFQA